MSFYDDASLIFLAGGEAGKDGKAYNIKPVEELGSELVTNGDFVNGSSNWSTYTSGSSNVVFSDDVATINIDGSNSNVGIYQENVFSSGVQYRIVLRAKGTSSFDAEVVESQAAATQQVISSFSLTTSYQDFVFTHTANGTNDIFIHRLFSASGANESIIIDSVSIKEITTPLADFTFSRGSNLTATRVDSNGLIEKGRENLLLQSNQFDTTWTTNNSSVTPNATTAPDGTNTASKIVENTASTTQHRINQTTTSSAGVKTFSVYLKQADEERDTAWLRIGLSGCYIDLSDGSTSGESANILSSSTPVGNDWYRISITKTNASANEIVRINIGTGDYSGDGTSGIFVWKAQYEEGLVATEPIESGATTGLAGILEDSPRFDYSGGASCPSLLLEPQRSNILGYSEYFEGGNWGLAGNATLQLRTSITAPDGSNAVYLLSGDGETITGRMQYNSGSSSDDQVYSIFIKGVSGVATRVRLQNSTSSSFLLVDIDSSGNVSFNSQTAHDNYYGIEDYGNGWYRLYLKTTTNGSGQLFRVYPDLLDGDGSVYIWGAQIEVQQYVTSYIPNHSGGSVTREAEEATLTYSNDFDDITVFAEVNSLDVIRDTSAQNIQIGNDFSQGGAFFLRRSSSTSPKRLLAFFKNNDNSDVFTSYELPEGDSKVAFKYNSTSNACKLFVDGSEVRSATATDITEFDTFRLNGDGGKFNSKQLVVFNTALSDADCITLTS